MEPAEALDALKELATRADVEVRIEPFTFKFLGKGGLCRVAGKQVILVDAALGTLEQAGVIGLALGSMKLRGVFVPRPLISYLRTGHGPIAKVPHLRPLARARHAQTPS